MKTKETAKRPNAKRKKNGNVKLLSSSELERKEREKAEQERIY